jgi:hypothetical protein
MPSRNAATARQVWWASVPVWSIGFLSPVPFLIYAIIHRTRRDWAVFAGYLAATVAMVVALGAAGSDDAATAGVGGFMIVASFRQIAPVSGHDHGVGEAGSGWEGGSRGRMGACCLVRSLRFRGRWRGPAPG